MTRRTAAARSFAYSSASSHPLVTRELVDEVADDLDRRAYAAQKRVAAVAVAELVASADVGSNEAYLVPQPKTPPIAVPDDADADDPLGELKP